jgi:hypothetical protein
MKPALQKTPRYRGTTTLPAEPILSVPDHVKTAHVLDCFYQNARAITYSDRLFAAGFKVVGDLSGKTETEIRKKVRTTDRNWQGFKWVLGTYGVRFH